MPNRGAASCTVTLSMTVKCTLSVRDWDGRINGKVKVRGMYGHVCYASCSRMRTRYMGLSASRKTLFRKRLIRGAPWSPLGCHEPLDDGCGGGGRKAVIPWGASLLFFFNNWYEKRF